jgi:hypothetical protein
MKYIKYKKHSEYTRAELNTLVNPAAEFKIVNLSEENNSKDLLYNAPRFGVLLDNNDGNPVTVNDDQLKVFINKEVGSVEDYDTLPSEEYYRIDSLYVLKNSGYNKNKENMHTFTVKYPGYNPQTKINFDDINEFVLQKESDNESDKFHCQIHMNWTNRDNDNMGTSDIDTHVFVYKMNENNELEFIPGGTLNREVMYLNKKFSNDDVTVVLSWDDVSSGANSGKGEFIKIQKKCTDEVYNKYYFVYCLNIFRYKDSNKLAVWDDVTINVTNGTNYVTTAFYPEATTETASRMWCGLLIKNNKVVSRADKFASSLEEAISASQFNYIPTSSAPGSGLPGKEISITLPEFTDELPEIPKE